MSNTSKELLNRIESHYNFSVDLFRQWGGNVGEGAYPLHTGFYSDPGYVREDDGPRKMTSKVMSLCAIEPNQRILDAGCGAGDLVFEIVKQYASNNVSVYGIDVARINLHQAINANKQGNFSNTFFSRQDYLNTAFKSNAFDRIVFFESLAHAQDSVGVLREASRLLKPKGKIIIADMFTKLELNEDQQATMDQFMSLSGISGFAGISSIYKHLTSLNFQVDVADITNNVLLSKKSEAFDVVELTEPTSNDLDKRTKHLQDLLLKIQEIMRSGKTGYYFIVASKI